MNMSVKFVAFFLLLLLSSSMKANSICFISDSSYSSSESSDEHVSMLPSNSSIDNSILYAVLALNPSVKSISLSIGFRLRKISDSSNAMIKSIIKYLSNMDTSSVLGRRRALYSNNFLSCMMTCDSYILALQRIQI